MSRDERLRFVGRWWVVVAAVAIGLGGAFVSSKLVEPEYRATCRLFVAPSASTLPGQTYQAAQVAQQRVASYLDLLKSDLVARGAIDSLHLNLSTATLLDRINATAEAESVLINVAVSDSQSQQAADLANAVCTQFQSVVVDAEGANAVVAVKLIERAKAPERPYSPILQRYLAVGGLSGLLFGLAIVGLLDRMQREPKGSRATSAQGVVASQNSSPTEDETRSRRHRADSPQTLAGREDPT